MAKVGMSKREWGIPPWRSRAFATAPALPSKIDVAIIGGGATGASAGYYLARAGLRTVIFEAGRIGSGASGRTGGIVLEGTATGPRDGARDCVPRLQALVAKLGIDCDLRLPGCWEIEHRSGPDLKTLPWRDQGAPISVARTVPGGAVEPGALVAGLAAAAVEAGAVVREQSRVSSLIPAARPKFKVKGEEIAADHIVVALNAWTPAILPRLTQVRSALTYACLTEPLDDALLDTIGLGARMPFYTADTPYLWGRVCADGGVVFGAGLTFGEPDELEDLTVADREPAAILERLEGRVRSLHPALNRVRIVARWGGPIAFREGLLPILARHPESARILIAGAYAGHGVAFSVRAGALLAAAILDETALPAWGGI